MYPTKSTLECHAALKKLRDEGQDLLEGSMPLDAVRSWQQRVEDQLAKLENDQPFATFPNPLDPGDVPVLADLTHQKLSDLIQEQVKYLSENILDYADSLPVKGSQTGAG